MQTVTHGPVSAQRHWIQMDLQHYLGGLGFFFSLSLPSTNVGLIVCPKR